MANFSFRENHLFNILDTFDSVRGPLDLFLRNYCRAHKALGPKDRRFISEAVYGITRWQGLIDHLCPTKPPTWEKRYSIYKDFEPTQYLNDASIPPHIRVSFPQNFFQFLSDALGEEEALKFCLTCNAPAPTTIRANTLKISRDALLAKWKDLYEISPCKYSSAGIVFHKKINFFELTEFKEGLFEIQDEGSQLIADLVQASPQDRVLDYCSGSGGKALALAPRKQGKGQIYLHDIRPATLLEAKKRLKRAGIQNAQIVLPSDRPKKNELKGTVHWVLVDAPCSGTGTLRRNPDMKWKFDLSLVERLVQEQRTIFEEALKFMNPKGHIVYATCSVLPQENEEQIAFFQEKFNLKLVGEPFKCTPLPGEMDGFFGAVLKMI